MRIRQRGSHGSRPTPQGAEDRHVAFHNAPESGSRGRIYGLNGAIEWRQLPLALSSEAGVLWCGGG